MTCGNMQSAAVGCPGTSTCARLMHVYAPTHHAARHGGWPPRTPPLGGAGAAVRCTRCWCLTGTTAGRCEGAFGGHARHSTVAVGSLRWLVMSQHDHILVVLQPVVHAPVDRGACAACKRALNAAPARRGAPLAMSFRSASMTASSSMGQLTPGHGRDGVHARMLWTRAPWVVASGWAAVTSSSRNSTS